jgi:hypothetical protein
MSDRIFTDLGLPPRQAADRAWLANAFYLGHHKLARNPDAATRPPKHLDHVVGLLVADPSPAKARTGG